MGLLDKLERGGLRADQGALPFDDPRLWTPTGSWEWGDTRAGFAVTPESAKRCSVVFACNSLIAETLASLPCILYRRLADGSKERARDHRVYRTLRQRPNRWMSPVDFFSGGQMWAGMRGNAMAEIIDSGDQMQLLPMHPERTVIEQLTSTRVRYQYNDPFQGPRTLLQDQVLHVRDISDDGFTGQARASLAREAIAVAQAGEAYVAGFFKNDATGRLLLSSPSTPDETKRKEYRRMIEENYAGWQNRSRTMLLWGGLTATELGKHDDSGFIIDPRNFQVADIARFWRVPLFMVGLEEKTTTWGTGIEQQMQGFIDFTIKPWLDRWAQAMARSLLDESEQEDYFIEFLLADLVRGDLKTRMEAYQIARQIGMYSPNELRAKENEGPRDGGDEYQQTPIGAAPNATAAAGPPPTSAPVDDAPPAAAAPAPPPAPAVPAPPVRATRDIPAPLLADAVTRIANRELADVGRRLARGGDKVAAWLEKYYAGHRGYAVQVLTPLGEAFGIDAAVLEQAAERIERTGLALATLPTFEANRRTEVAEVLDETLTAGAAARQE